MKKAYEAPKAEVVKFEYKDQVVAASGLPAGCTIEYRMDGNPCTNSTPIRANN